MLFFFRKAALIWRKSKNLFLLSATSEQPELKTKWAVLKISLACKREEREINILVILVSSSHVNIMLNELEAENLLTSPGNFSRRAFYRKC